MTSPNKHRRDEQGRVDGRGVALLHTERRRVADQVTVGGIGRAGAHLSWGEVGDQVNQRRGARVVGGMDNELADAGFEEGDGDRAARAVR
jgi:hypothetical protein